MFEGKKILVVEDDPDILEILRYILEEEAYVVSSLREGHELFRTIDSFGPDLVLMDIRLPDADGSELCAKLRKQMPQLPVILLSAGYYQIGAVNIKNAPSDFIEKPFLQDDVLRKVRSNLISL